MAYFLNTTLPNKQKLKFALTQIMGIGKAHSQLFCRKLGFSDHFKVFELTKIQKLKIIRQIEISEESINSDLRRILKVSKARLVSLRTYRGIRSKQGFPVRGQRTHTNSKTAKKFKYS